MKERFASVMTLRSIHLIYYAFYNLALILVSPAIAIYLLGRYISGKSRSGWRERWGFLPDPLLWKPGSRPRIWVHAVSAGEVVAAVPIIREVRAVLPDHELFLSVTTPAGKEMACDQAAPLVNAILFSPFDFPWVVRRTIAAINPAVFVSLESELWPNLLSELKRRDVKTVMVNGRISDGNYRRVRLFARGLFRWMLSNVDFLLMQSKFDAERIAALSGARVGGGKTVVIGNSKFDQEIPQVSEEEARTIRSNLGLPEDAPVLVAGSTRSAREEECVLAAYAEMRLHCKELCLVIAPRHVARSESLAEAMRAAGLTPVLRTRVRPTIGETPPVRHLILDTMGDLAQIYAIATVAFVGNSFEPVVKGGGQNLLQPLAHGKPVLFGPRTATIRSEVALATETGVGFRVNDAHEMAAKGSALIADSGWRADIAVRSQDLIATNRGASKRYAVAIAGLMRSESPRPIVAP